MSTKSSHGSGHAATTATAKDETAATPATKGTKHAASAIPAVIAAPAPAPTSAQIATMLEQLAAMPAMFGTGAALTIAGRRSLLKIRPGGEEHATTVLDLADRYGLTIPGITSADVAADVKLVQELTPLVARLQTMLGLATDVSLSAESRTWGAATKAYSMMIRLVSEYPALQTELAPMASFLAIKYKDAPTSLRTQEKNTLARTRSAKKAKKDAEGEATAAQAAPAAEAAPAAAAPAAAKPVTGANAPS